MSDVTVPPAAPAAVGGTQASAAPTGVLVTFCLADLARALLTGLITSYLMVVFIPQSTSSLPVLLPAAAVTFAVVRGVGSVIDAVIDPVIAYLSDRSDHGSGRRIPFMRWAVLPWAVSTLLVVMTPVDHASWVNAVWVGVILLINLVSSSVYLVPFYALQAELVTDTRRRVWFFTINTLFFVVGSAVVFLSPVIKGALDTAGLGELNAWRATFAIFSVLGFVFAAIPAFAIRERRWVAFEPAYVPLWSSFRATLRYRNFVVLLAAYLVMWVAFALFNATLLYYVTMLIGAPESFATVVSGLAIAVGIASYWPINALARRFGKKPLMIGACVAYVVIYTAIYHYALVLSVMPGTAFAVLIGVLIGFPISVTNILPAAAFADLTQYDTITTGVNRAGMFFASRNFITSLSQSVVLFVTPALIALGSTTGQATVPGVRLTAGVAAVTIAAATVLYVCYDDRHVTRVIDDHNAAVVAAAADATEAGPAGVVVCVPVTAERQVAHGWGRARRLALVTVAEGRIADWTEHEVRWDELHGVGTEGSHHARVVRFLREHHVEVVVAQHMGAPMARTLDRLGVRRHLGADGDAEAAVLAVIAGP